MQEQDVNVFFINPREHFLKRAKIGHFSAACPGFVSLYLMFCLGRKMFKCFLFWTGIYMNRYDTLGVYMNRYNTLNTMLLSSSRSVSPWSVVFSFVDHVCRHNMYLKHVKNKTLVSPSELLMWGQMTLLSSFCNNLSYKLERKYRTYVE